MLLWVLCDRTIPIPGKQWHIGWDDGYYAFLRDLPDEKLVVVYNNDAKLRELKIPVGDTPLENVSQLQPVFGTVPAEVAGGTVHVALPAQTIAIFSVR